jgi:hypothetical protein
MLWEDPVALWTRLKLGREEYLQRLLTTLILGGVAPAWNTPTPPSPEGIRFFRALDADVHGEPRDEPDAAGAQFVDEYLLPKLDESLANGWPDWAVLWDDGVWLIELKTEAASHRHGQLALYLALAAAAHPARRVDLTYITGPLDKPAPELGHGQRYGHLTWGQVLPIVDEIWGQTADADVQAYLRMVRTVIGNLTTMKPSEQRAAVLGAVPGSAVRGTGLDRIDPADGSDLLKLARATAADGKQRATGAIDPIDLETIRDSAWSQISALTADDQTRFVLPWLWNSATAGGRALTPEGAEFGYELRFSLYKTMQVKP